jgi:hypothetical protein
MQNKKHQKQKRSNNSIARISHNILSSVNQDNRIYRRRLTVWQGVSSNAISVIASQFSMDPSGTTDWASCSALYDEFRVLGIKISLFPKTQFSVTNLQNALAIVYDNDGGGALASYNEAADFQTLQLSTTVWTTPKPVVYEFVRPTAGNGTIIPWIDIAAPTNSVGTIKLYADALTASIAYFNVLIEYSVEFRGIR